MRGAAVPPSLATLAVALCCSHAAPPLAQDALGLPDPESGT